MCFRGQSQCSSYLPQLCSILASHPVVPDFPVIRKCLDTGILCLLTRWLSLLVPWGNIPGTHRFIFRVWCKAGPLLPGWLTYSQGFIYCLYKCVHALMILKYLCSACNYLPEMLTTVTRLSLTVSGGAGTLSHVPCSSDLAHGRQCRLTQSPWWKSPLLPLSQLISSISLRPSDAVSWVPPEPRALPPPSWHPPGLCYCLCSWNFPKASPPACLLCWITRLSTSEVGRLWGIYYTWQSKAVYSVGLINRPVIL